MPYNERFGKVSYTKPETKTPFFKGQEDQETAFEKKSRYYLNIWPFSVSTKTDKIIFTIFRFGGCIGKFKN